MNGISRWTVDELRKREEEEEGAGKRIGRMEWRGDDGGDGRVI